MAIESLAGSQVASLQLEPRPAIEGGGGGGAGAAPGTSFAAALEHALGELKGAQAAADEQSVGFVTGQEIAVHELMATVTEAEIAAQLTTAVAAKAIQAYQEIWRMEL